MEHIVRDNAYISIAPGVYYALYKGKFFLKFDRSHGLSSSASFLIVEDGYSDIDMHVGAILEEDVTYLRLDPINPNQPPYDSFKGQRVKKRHIIHTAQILYEVEEKSVKDSKEKEGDSKN